jgi:3-oxoacyl-[acyl-carrier protein] reductase
MDLELAGKKAVVIGATRGIGRAIAEVLIDEGCDIAIGARNSDQVAATIATLGAGTARVTGGAVDAGDGPGLEQFVAAMAEELGGIDIYISNASGAFGGGNDLGSWQRGVEVDVLGTVRGCEAALPYLEQSDHGAIVLIGTVSSIESVGDRRAYNSVKAAILPYAKGLARDTAPHNVRCNVVSPGQIYFPGGVWNLVEEHAPERFAEALARNPMGRMGTPNEVANAVAFLASPRASFISGTHLLVDGARTQNVQF